MKTITKGKNMNNLKKVGLTALAGSLAAISANAAEMTVSGATLLTYTSGHSTEVTGNPLGMKTNLGFTASGDVNGYTVSYMQTSADKFAGMSSARLSVDMGDMGTIAFDQGSGSGLGTIDDKTPTAAEEIWDGLDAAAASAKDKNGLVGTTGASGVINYVQTFEGVTFNGAFRKGAGGSASDGGTTVGTSEGAYDFALTASGDTLGAPGMTAGLGYGVDKDGASDDKHNTIFANYAVGPVTVGAQLSRIDNGGTTTDTRTEAFGIAFNVNDNLSVSYGIRDVEYDKNAAANVTEDGEGLAIAYTMGSIKIAGNRNEVSNNHGTLLNEDSMTEIALSFAF